MTLDKQTLRETIARYQAWNDEVFASQVLERQKQTPEKKWQAYQDLYDFAMEIKRTSSLWEQEKTMQEWLFYFQGIERFEEWRQQNGKTA